MVSETTQHENGEDPITFRIDSGADNHYVDSEPFPNIEKIREVTILDPPTRINTFGGQVSLGSKSGILQVNTRSKDGKTMALGMGAIVTAGTGLNLFSTPRAAKNGLYSHIES